MKKINYLLVVLVVAFTIISCSSDSGDDDVIDTPETFGSWSPAFTDQTSNFTQTRTGNQGSSETRNITVSSTASSEETDEYSQDSDINGDGDKVDDITLITTTYSASNNLGSNQIDSYQVDEDRAPTFLMQIVVFGTVN